MSTQQVRTLDQELRLCLKQINSQIEQIRQQAEISKIPPVTMVDDKGNYIWAPLVVAKAQVLHSMTVREIGTYENDH